MQCYKSRENGIFRDALLKMSPSFLIIFEGNFDPCKKDLVQFSTIYCSFRYGDELNKFSQLKNFLNCLNNFLSIFSGLLIYHPLQDENIYNLKKSPNFENTVDANFKI
jgi:hypothetical protein